MSSAATSSKPTPGQASVRLTLPSAARKRLTEADIRCTPDVSLEYQRAANGYVLRGRESGGALQELGRYVGFCGPEGEPLGWFLKPDSLTVNSDHAIVLAPAIASIEMFRYEHTYELLITRYRIVQDEEKRPKAASEQVFRGWQGQLPLDLVTKDKALAGTIAPEFFDRAGEPRQLPAKFVKPVQAITRAVNCVKCSHAHLLIKPQSSQLQKSAEEAPALIAVNGKQPEDASEHPAEAAVA
jgi:hypothetical protein